MMEAYFQEHSQEIDLHGLECRYYRNQSSSAVYHVHLTIDGIVLTPEESQPSHSMINRMFNNRKKKRSSEEILAWSDILGASTQLPTLPILMEQVSDQQSFIIYMLIPKYDYKKRNTSGSLIERIPVHYIFHMKEKQGIKKLGAFVQHVRYCADPRSFTSSIPSAPIVYRPRKYLIYINPVGGSGRAQYTYDTIVSPLFYQSEIQCEVVRTEYQHHATQHIHTIPLGYYDAIVAVGGDGLLSELVQGIMTRKDWQQAIQTLILGIIPGGSGNGLSASLLTRAREQPSAINATYALIKGVVHEMDMATCVNGHQEVFYSFLSLAWAFAAHVDMESEKYRCLGGLRFTVSAVARILAPAQEFKGTLCYLNSVHDTTLPVKYHERPNGFEGEVAPEFECIAMRHEKTPRITGEWLTISGHFNFFMAMNVSHAATDLICAPNAQLNDGYYTIVCCPRQLTRMEMVALLLAMEHGTHVNNEYIRFIRTRAFTLQLDKQDDIISLDGELFKGPLLQMEVHRAMGRVMCLPMI